MMCYLGLSQSNKSINPGHNPYTNITDYESYSVGAKNFETLEAAMADIYSRDFMRNMKLSLKEKVPLMEFRDKLLNQKQKTRDSFDLI